MDQSRSNPANIGPRRLAIWEICLLVAGQAVGFWLFGMEPDGSLGSPYGILIGVLGGASVVGTPILLWKRRRRKARWGPGQILWFSEGMAAWLLWPPIVVARVRQAPPRIGGDAAAAQGCFLYGTPLMALYVASALLFGGWIRRRGRKRRRSWSWRERFGLILGALWAATGLYVLGLVYSEDFK